VTARKFFVGLLLAATSASCNSRHVIGTVTAGHAGSGGGGGGGSSGGRGGASGSTGGPGGAVGGAGLAGAGGGAAGDGGGGGGGTGGGVGGSGGAGGGAGTGASDADAGTPTDGFPGWGPPPCTGAAAASVPSGGKFVAVTGTLAEIVVDPCNEHVYVTNSSSNRVEDYSVMSGALQAPIAVGSVPVGLDVTPDNRQLYVANSGGTNLSVVDLATRQEQTKINFTSGISGDRALSVAITANGKALFSTTFAGSGFGGRLLSADVTNGAVTQRTDFFINGTTTEATFLRPSGDHTVVGAIAGDISSGPVFAYRAAADAFAPEHDLNGFLRSVAVSPDGTLISVDGALVLDATLNLLGTVTGGSGGLFAAFGPSGTVLYRPKSNGIEIVDPARFLVTGTIPVTADTLTISASSVRPLRGPSIGDLVVSSDGKWLAVITDHGITILAIP